MEMAKKKKKSFFSKLIVGLVIGFFVSRALMKKYLKKNPPINEQMIKAMMIFRCILISRSEFIVNAYFEISAAETPFLYTVYQWYIYHQLVD